MVCCLDKDHAHPLLSKLGWPCVLPDTITALVVNFPVMAVNGLLVSRLGIMACKGNEGPYVF